MPESNQKVVKKQKKERKKEAFGEVIVCGRRSYVIEDLLGSGGFGDVYQVLQRKTDKRFAMKTERFDALENPNNRRLGIETTLYDAIQSGNIPEKIIDKNHFAKMLDYGRTPEFKFLIMEIVGPSLWDIRTKMMIKTTSPHTIATIARQSLEAIEALHDLGWLHRDLKPHNFAIGAPGREKTIFLLDFGIARCYREPDGRIKPPRKRVHWMGTKRYTSARAQMKEEQARRDDCESWCYMILEYYYSKNLSWSWNEWSEKMQIAMKIHFMTKPHVFREKGQLKLPQRFCDIMLAVSALSFTANPDYAGMYKTLDQIIRDEKIDMSLPLDWIGKMMPADKEKEKYKDSAIRIDAEPLSERRRKLEQDLMQLYKDIGEPKTLEEVQEEIRKKGRKERAKDDDCSERSDDSEDERDRRRRRKKRRTQEFTRDGTDQKKKRNKRSREKRREDAQKGIKAKKEDIEYQLEYISSELDDAGAQEAHADYRKLAEEVHAVQDEKIIDRLWIALKNPIVYIMDEKRKTIVELREIIKGTADEAKSPRTKRIKGKKDDIKAKLRFIANAHYKRHIFDRCEDYLHLAEDVTDVQKEAVLDKMLSALNLSLKLYLEDDKKKRFLELEAILKGGPEEAGVDKEKDRKKTPEKPEKPDEKDKKADEEKAAAPPKEPSPSKESRETVPSKETVQSKEPVGEGKKITKDMVRAQLVVIAARSRFNTAETVDYLKMADELKEINNQATLDRMYQALDNYETYMDDETMLRALKEVTKDDVRLEKERKKAAEKPAEKEKEKGVKDKKPEKDKDNKKPNKSPAKAADDKKEEKKNNEKKKDDKEKPSPAKATPPAAAKDPAKKDVGVSKKK